MFSSKFSKIILGSVVGLGLVVVYSIVRINNQEYQVETIRYQLENRQLHCYNGVQSLQTLSNSSSNTYICDLTPCGGGPSIEYTVVGHPGNGCHGGTEQQQFECTVDNCMAGTQGSWSLLQQANDAVKKDGRR